MNIYNAIMKAADHIEKHPERFDYWSTMVPHSEGCQACLLGWIGFYFGQTIRDDIHGPIDQRITLLGVHYSVFYAAIAKMSDVASLSQADPKRLAAGLRLYAAEYHEKAAITGIPDSVRQIFAELPGERVS